MWKGPYWMKPSGPNNNQMTNILSISWGSFSEEENYRITYFVTILQKCVIL